MDLFGAAAALTLGAPALVLIAIGVRWAAGPGVLHVQPRVGLRGRVFNLYKFRTLPLESAIHSDRQWIAEATHPYLAWLRRTGLDELPQLWNVLRGEMSMVGPRPERPYFVEKFARAFPHYEHRLEGLPGMTGWAQVHGLRGDTSIAHRLDLDLEYLERQSLTMDLRILASTAVHVALEMAGRGNAPGLGKAWLSRSTSSTF
jgi:lipopolysaccharide/colanic/teichoic acid biosynthesis glycosyltransferase